MKRVEAAQPQRSRFVRRCRRCNDRIMPSGWVTWLEDDTLFPGLEGTPGGYCCLACTRRLLGRRIRVPAA